MDLQARTLPSRSWSASQKVLAALKEGGDTSRIESDLATFQEREDAVGTARWRTLEEKYMRLG